MGKKAYRWSMMLGLLVVAMLPGSTPSSTRGEQPAVQPPGRLVVAEKFGSTT